VLTKEDLEFRLILNLGEVAGMLGITPEALRDRVRRGVGAPPALRTGKSIVFRTEDVLHWLENLERVEPHQPRLPQPVGSAVTVTTTRHDTAIIGAYISSGFSLQEEGKSGPGPTSPVTSPPFPS